MTTKSLKKSTRITTETIASGSTIGQGGQVPLQPTGAGGDSPLSILKREFLKYLYFDPGQDMALNYIFAVAVANRWMSKSYPIWTYLIGPPSVGKTTILRTFPKGDEFFFLDNLTANSLVSGYRGKENNEEDPSLLPKIIGKTLIINDFGTMLKSQSGKQADIFADLRRLYDSDSFTSHKGNIGEIKFEKVCFGLFAAVTRDVESLQTEVGPLGERFLAFELSIKRSNEFKAMDKGSAWANRKKEVEAELSHATERFLKSVPACPEFPETSHDTYMKIVEMARLTAPWRTYVKRINFGDYATAPMLYKPVIESPARLVSQLHLVAQGHAIANNRTTVNSDDLDLISLIAWYSVPSWRREVLLRLLTENLINPSEIARDIEKDSKSVRRQINDLVALRLINECDRGKYCASPIDRELIDKVKPYWKKMLCLE